MGVNRPWSCHPTWCVDGPELGARQPPRPGPGAQGPLPAPYIWRWLSLNSQSGLSMGPRQKVAEGQAWRLLLTHLRWFIGWELLPWEGLAALRTSPNKSCHLQGQHRCLWGQLGNVRCLLSSLSQAFHEHEHAPACTQCAVGAL